MLCFVIMECVLIEVINFIVIELMTSLLIEL
jgi:hypothetical protein